MAPPQRKTSAFLLEQLRLFTPQSGVSPTHRQHESCSHHDPKGKVISLLLPPGTPEGEGL